MFIVFDEVELFLGIPSYHNFRLDEMKMNGIGSRKLINSHLGDATVSLHYDRDKKTFFSIDQSFGYITSYQDES